MKKVEALIRPNKLVAVKEALAEIGINGMSVFRAIGLGRQEGYTEIYRGEEYTVTYFSKIKLEILVKDDQLDPCINAIMESSRTGEIGDGKIYVSSIDEVIRIRTGEKNHEAM